MFQAHKHESAFQFLEGGRKGGGEDLGEGCESWLMS